MIHEIFPCLYLIRTADPGAKAQYTYLLRRPAGNILLATKADMADDWDGLRALGRVSHILLGDRHHVGAASAALSAKLGVPLSATKVEAAAARQPDLPIADILGDGRYHLADDWHFASEGDHWKFVAEGRRRTRAAKPMLMLDARPVSYGRRMLEFVGRESLAASCGTLMQNHA